MNHSSSNFKEKKKEKSQKKIIAHFVNALLPSRVHEAKEKIYLDFLLEKIK